MRRRRSFLATLSAFVAAPAAVAVPAIAAQALPDVGKFPTSSEPPELLALGEQLQARLATYREAAARKVTAREHYERIKPALPDEMIVPESVDRVSDLSVVEWDPMRRREAEPYRRIYDRRRLQIHIIARDVPKTTKRGRQLRRLARLAKEHEAGREAAIRLSGYHEAEEEARHAAEAVCDLAVPLLQHTPASMVGLAIFAKAVLAAQEVKGDLLTGSPTYFSALGRHVAKALLELQGGGA
jgi:hypothetical protein